MFSIKKVKKKVPKELLLPVPMRIVVILQLCFVLCVLLSALLSPFMYRLFYDKKEKLLCHYLLGNSEESHCSRFFNLPEEQQLLLIKYDSQLKNDPKDSFSRTLRSIQKLFFDLPLFKRVWIVLALIISILLLTQKEGAFAASWLLPLTACLYLLQNLALPPDQLSKEMDLYPSEEWLTTKYIKKPLGISIEEQREQLTLAWKQFLVHKWLHQIPEKDPLLLKKQHEEASYLFNLCRLHFLMEEKTKRKLPIKEPPLLLGLYCFWNFFFAGFLTLAKR